MRPHTSVVATVIGEEGLDFGEVDLIVCYDAKGSPIRAVQVLTICLFVCMCCVCVCVLCLLSLSFSLSLCVCVCLLSLSFSLSLCVCVCVLSPTVSLSIHRMTDTRGRDVPVASDKGVLCCSQPKGMS